VTPCIQSTVTAAKITQVIKKLLVSIGFMIYIFFGRTLAIPKILIFLLLIQLKMKIVMSKIVPGGGIGRYGIIVIGDATA